mmetsp:Transcript_71538/g.191015  ORF Transcript_71538/g.191015 Transcript_71538/m.191015 type:complete len:132 (-) Transcript_71538:6-401(-)
MESVWGSIRNIWSKPGAQSKPQLASEAQRLDRAVDQRKSTKQEPVKGRGISEAKTTKSYSDDWMGKQRQLEDQQDEDLDHISRAVKDLKAMSLDMGHTLDAQTSSIERLADRTDAVDARLAKSNVRVKRML